MKKINGSAWLLVLILSISSVIFAQEKTAQDYLTEGVELAKSNQYEDALRAFRKGVELKYRESLAMSKRSLGITPNLPEAVHNAGTLSARFGEIDEARQ